MKIFNKIFSSKKTIFLFVFVVLALFSVKTVFAVWNGTFYEPGDTLNPECLPTDPDCDVRSPLTSVNISDTAYDATTWDGDATHAPSKNAIRDKIESLITGSHNPVTLGASANGLSLATQVLSLALASTSTTGALSDTDWNTFNNKQAALNGTGFIKISGTTISYDNSTYVTGTPWTLVGYLTSAITSLNGLTGATQTFANGTTGTAPSWSSATTVHTLEIPMASASGVTAGLLSKADYDAFSAKLSSLSGAVNDSSDRRNYDK